MMPAHMEGARSNAFGLGRTQIGGAPAWLVVAPRRFPGP